METDTFKKCRDTWPEWRPRKSRFWQENCNFTVKEATTRCSNSPYLTSAPPYIRHHANAPLELGLYRKISFPKPWERTWDLSWGVLRLQHGPPPPALIDHLPKNKNLLRGIEHPWRLQTPFAFWKYRSISPPEGWGYVFRWPDNKMNGVQRIPHFGENVHILYVADLRRNANILLWYWNPAIFMYPKGNHAGIGFPWIQR